MAKLCKYDVLVIGGGTSGAIAAIAATINGAKTLVIEKEGFIGGTVTGQPLEAMMTFHDIHGQIIAGIPQMIVDRLIHLGGSPGHVADGFGYCATITPYNHEVLKSLFARLFSEFKIDVMLNSQVFNLSLSNDQIDEVIIKNRQSEIRVLADTIIDASGNGITFELCDIEYTKGSEKDNLMQPASMLFKLSNVNALKFRLFMSDNLNQFKSFFENSNLQSIISKKERYLHTWGLKNLLKDSYSKGKLSYKKGEIQMLIDTKENTAIINGTRADNIDGNCEDDVQKAYFILRSQVIELYSILKEHVPGFENSTLSAVSDIVGIRETRHLRGEYIIRSDDIINKKKFYDGIAFGAFPIDIHQPNSFSIDHRLIRERYEIPYRCMLPCTINNLLVTGRCISSTHTASGSLRTTVTCMALGQVSGIAAAMAVKKKVSVKDINLEEFRILLNKAGAIYP